MLSLFSSFGYEVDSFCFVGNLGNQPFGEYWEVEEFAKQLSVDSTLITIRKGSKMGMALLVPSDNVVPNKGRRVCADWQLFSRSNTIFKAKTVDQHCNFVISGIDEELNYESIPWAVRRKNAHLQSKREQIELSALNQMNSIERIKYGEFSVLRKLLTENSSVPFEVDHAKTIHEHGCQAIDYRNLQIVTKTMNEAWGKKSHPRMTFEQQADHLRVAVARDAIDDVLEYVLYRLEPLFLD
ncbi:hypothetical protein FL840_23635 [Vibrio parahaemolyticus]|nr:hypothetical protein [Vibrio parahaemolyticus]